MNQPLDSVISSQLGVALILDQHINRPGNVKPDLQTAINNAGPQPNANKLDIEVTNKYALERQKAGHMQDGPARTKLIVKLGLDPNHGSFQGW